MLVQSKDQSLLDVDKSVASKPYEQTTNVKEQSSAKAETPGALVVMKTQSTDHAKGSTISKLISNWLPF